MNICKIIALTPGKPWTFNNNDTGTKETMYPFTVVLEDHTTGQANAKTNPPAYKVGDLVGYDISGQTPRGENKLKITRNPDMSRGKLTSPPPMEHMEGDPLPAGAFSRGDPGASTRPAREARSVAQNAPADLYRERSPNDQAKHNQAVHGATVGQAINKAVEIWLAGREGQPWDAQAIGFVEDTAYSIIQISQRLEKGEAPSGVPF